ncbi:MAG: SpoIID/LytB domain-containing protein [Candidatus Polarisedimenticolia bacterium]
MSLRTRCCLLAALCAAAFAARADEPALRLPPAAPSLFARIDPGRPVPPPRLRVAVKADEGQVRVGATNGGGFRLLDGRTGQELWPDRAAGTVLVVPAGGKPNGAGKIYKIQVGAFRDETAAKEQAQAYATRLGAPAEAAKDAMRGVYRVRIGAAEKPAELQPLLEALRAAGHSEAWIASEPKPAPPSAVRALRLVDSRWEARDAGTDSVVVAPRGDAGRATVDGRPYRGLVEVTLSVAGGILAVNEVNLEDYLRGVVPEELGPSLFPELEAQKAQAIAARTYAAANRGQYADEGYDLCDTPRCQVYGGAAVERPLSDQAVRETEGQVLAYGGAPINALFTSTCGGHTEDVEAVFPEQAAPYLRAVPCRAEEELLDHRTARLRGRGVETRAGAEDATAADALQLARLVAHGLAPRGALDGRWRDRAVATDELNEWAASLARLAGKGPLPPFSGRPTRLALWRWLAPLLGVPDGGAAYVPPGDADLLLEVDDRDGVPAADRQVVAALVLRGVVRPISGRLAPDGVPSRGETLGWIARAADLEDAAPAREGWFVGYADGVVRVREKGNGVREFVYEQDLVDLLAENAGFWRRVGSLDVLPGDRVVFVGDPATERALVFGLRERQGSADDRNSPRFRWTIARDRAALEAKLADLAPVGTLQDVVVARRGRSGRVASIDLRGSAGRATVEGFRFSRAIDLPETLFTMDIQREKDGALRRIVFHGRGWGHGVGLCQYGAYGMAQRGADVRAILAHYYTGAGLVALPAE